MLHSNLSVNTAGHLVIGKSDVVELSLKYGTPLYVLDEERVRANCRAYREALEKYAYRAPSFPSITVRGTACICVSR